MVASLPEPVTVSGVTDVVVVRLGDGARSGRGTGRRRRPAERSAPTWSD